MTTIVLWRAAGLFQRVLPQMAVLLLLLVTTRASCAVALPVKINFQPTASTVPVGYLKDDGSLYASRGNGFTYGWSVSHTAATSQRGVNADARLDTLVSFHAGAAWEIALPNGTYSVFASIGDPSNASTHTLTIEGVSCWNALPLAANQFANTTKIVYVTDGKLTIDQGSASELATRLNYVEINSDDSSLVVTTIGGTGGAGFSGNGGLANVATFNHPHGVAQDAAGNVFVGDHYNHCVRKIAAGTHVITNIAGIGGAAGFSGDGGLATAATLYYPTAVAVDSAGNVYVADYFNNRIRKITVSTGIITTIAGAGSGGDGGPAISASLYNPNGVNLDSSGNIYICEGAAHRIRKVTQSTGIISTIVGNGVAGFSGDGGVSTSAQINTPCSVTVDSSDNVFFTDANNNRIRKILAGSGIISTVAGNGVGAFSGDGTLATSASIYQPQGCVVDAEGNIYIADHLNSRIRKVTASSGLISTLAGGGASGADGVLATTVSMNGPIGLWWDAASSSLTYADFYNNRVRKITGAPLIAVPAKASPSPTTGATTVLSVMGSAPAGEASLVYTWATSGAQPASVSFSANGTNAAKTTTATFSKEGDYSFVVTVTDGNGLSVSSPVAVTVVLTNTVAVTPATVSVSQTGTQLFSAIAKNQFGVQMVPQPTFTWNAGGAGTMSGSLLTAGTTAGTYSLSATGSGITGTASVTVLPTPTVTVVVSDATAFEPGDDLGRFTLQLSQTTTIDRAITVVISGTATNGVDYNQIGSTIVIPGGSSSVGVVVYPSDDTTAESSETVILTLAAGTGYTVGSPSAGTVTIKDNEAAVVTIAATDNAASEPGASKGTGVFTVTAKGSLAQARTVTYAVTGTATSGSDYTALSGSLSLAANVASATITVTALNDVIAESDETVIVTLTGGTNCVVGSPAAATVTIWDDEAQVVTVAATDAAAAETGANTGTWTITRVGLKTAARAVTYTSVGGTATAGSDFTALSGTVTIAANAATATVVVTPLNDALSEGSETVILTLAAGTGYTVGSPAAATVTIADDEPAVSIMATDPVAFETGADQGLFTLTRTGVTTAALNVLYDITGSAISGSDYTALSGTATFAIGSTTTTIPIVAIDDALFEGVETVQLTLRVASTYYILPTANTAVVEMGDDESNLSTITIVATDATATEPGTDQGLFTITRTGGSTAASLVVTLSVSGTATPGTDYQSLPIQVTINAGASTATVAVIAVNDAVAEASETIIATIAPKAIYRVGSPAAATVTLKDEESPVVNASASDATASEPGAGQGTGAFRITRTGNLSTAITVTYLISGTATSGSDFTALSGTASLAANVSTATITVTALDDALAETDETAVMTLQAGAGYTLGATTAATVTILDDETPSLSILATDNLGSEPTADTITFTVTRKGKKSTALTAPLTTSGLATAAVDYTIAASVSLAANAVTGTVVVTPIDDSLVEGIETVTVTLGTGAGYVIGTASDTALLYDDEPVISIAAPDAAASEVGLDIGRLVVSRVGKTTAVSTVNLTIGGTATPGVDYQAIPSVVTIPIGAAQVVIPVIPVADQNGSEGAETVIVTLNAGSAYTLGTPVSSTVPIADNRAPTLSISATPVTGAPPLLVQLSSTATDPDGQALTYQWSVDGGIGVIATTAAPSYSFTRPGPNVVTLTVSDGWMQTSQSVTIEVVPSALTITTPLIISATDFSYDWRDLTVTGTTATIDGNHNFRSLTLTSGAVVTHPACDATTTHSLVVSVTNLVSIDATSRIDVSSKGFPMGFVYPGVPYNTTLLVGNTGGSHGGIGSLPYNIYGQPIGSVAVEAYGDPITPTTPGSGAVNGGGSNGGGVIRLTAASLSLNGSILANGGQGGAGGSILLNVTQISGAGTCSAMGGPGGGYIGSGGGGRIALTYTTVTGSLPVLSTKGQFSGGAPASGAGTIYVKQQGAGAGSLQINAEGVRISTLFPTPVDATQVPVGADLIITDADVSLDGSFSLARLIITANAIVTHPASTSAQTHGIDVVATTSIAVDVGSRIDVTGKGYPKGVTSGRQILTTASDLVGGSNGGWGSKRIDWSYPNGGGFANALSSILSGQIQPTPFNQFVDPQEPGGGSGLNSSGWGGAGGGLVRFTAPTITLDGDILALGAGADGWGAGGAGGSILANGSTVVVTSRLCADGAAGSVSPDFYGRPMVGSGSGGGGRIALVGLTASSDTTQVSANGGNPYGGIEGSSGTVYLHQTADPGAVLRLNSANASATYLFANNDFDVASPPTWIWYGPLTSPFSEQKFPYILSFVLTGGATYKVVGNPAVFDRDDDGLFDWDEVTLGTNPNDPDTNHDGISDGASVALGINPLDTTPDPDGDGISTSVEVAIGTDPYRADTDGDGVSDISDAYPTDPTRSVAPGPVSGDVTPPTITIDVPIGAVPLD